MVGPGGEQECCSDNPIVVPRVEYLLTAVPLAIIISSMVLDFIGGHGTASGEV